MHRPRPITALAVAAPLMLALAACGAADASPSTGAGEPSAAASVSAETTEPTEPAAPSVDATATADATAEDEEEVRVRLDGFAFDTDELTIAAGTEVTFLNTDAAAHTVTEGVDGVAAEGARFDMELAANQADSVTFDEPGTYQVTCLFHPSMNMTVIVEG